MANRIILKRSSTASSVPAAASLEPGELAINLADRKLFSKNTGGTVLQIVGTLGNQDANSVAITGGSLDGVVIGATTRAAATVASLNVRATGIGTMGTIQFPTESGQLNVRGSPLGAYIALRGSTHGTTPNQLSIYGDTIYISNVAGTPWLSIDSTYGVWSRQTVRGPNLSVGPQAGTDSGGGSAFVYGYGANQRLAFYRANGTPGTPLANGSTTQLGAVEYYGHDGTAFGKGCEILALATETWGAGRGSRVMIRACANGSTSLSTSAIFTSTGINSTAIGATTPSTGAFTSLSVTTGQAVVGTNTLGSTPKFSLGFDQGVNVVGLGVQNTSTTNSGYFLHFYNSAGSAAGFVQQTGSTTVNYATSSDARLKTNIRDYLPGNLIDLIKPRLFDWKTGEKDVVGFVAQELDEVFPQAVCRGETWGVDPSKLVAALVAELQSLRRRVARLENA